MDCHLCWLTYQVAAAAADAVLTMCHMCLGVTLCCCAAGGFHTVAVVGFIAPLAVTVLGPATGQLLDQSPRQQALNFCAVVQGICIVLSGESCILHDLFSTAGAELNRQADSAQPGRNHQLQQLQSQHPLQSQCSMCA